MTSHNFVVPDHPMFTGGALSIRQKLYLHNTSPDGGVAESYLGSRVFIPQGLRLRARIRRDRRSEKPEPARN